MNVGAITRGRAAAEALMSDTFTAYKFDTVTVDGLSERQWVQQYVTVGKVSSGSQQGRDTSTRTVNVAGVDRFVMEGGLHIPLSAGLPAIGWEFECTAVGAASDPPLVGRRWHVVSVPAKSYATARRLDVVEV